MTVVAAAPGPSLAAGGATTGPAGLEEFASSYSFDERESRAASSARRCEIDGLMAPAPRRSSILSVIVPADGTSAAGGGTGDFGTSPVFGQLSGKPFRLPVSDQVGCQKVKNNDRS